MMEVEIGNVAEAITNLTELGATEPVVKATITLSESGFISVSDAVAYGDIKDESIAGKSLYSLLPMFTTLILFYR